MNNKISRRRFTRVTLTGSAAFVALNQFGMIPEVRSDSPCIRLGGPVFGDYRDPHEWAADVKGIGYSAAYCPVEPGTDEVTSKGL